MRKLIGLSAFNGYGGLSVSATMAGIKFDALYSSEIDKHANQAAQLIDSSTIQLGSILDWRAWDIDWPELGFLSAGSPCQGFSPAGLKGGTKAIVGGIEVVISTREEYISAKNKEAEFLSESYLFWEFVLMLDHALQQNPNLKFMLENVKMTPNNKNMITEALGVEPVLINAELLLPQNRERLFWCNFDIAPIERKHVNIIDIIEDGDYKLRPCSLREKIGTGVCHHIADAIDIGNNKSMNRVYATSGKAPTLTTMQGGLREPKFIASYNPPLYRLAVMIEMMRIQGVPAKVSDLLLSSGIANTNLKKLIGNGWPLDVIAHILKCGIDLNQ